MHSETEEVSGTLHGKHLEAPGHSILGAAGQAGNAEPFLYNWPPLSV